LIPPPFKRVRRIIQWIGWVFESARRIGQPARRILKSARRIRKPAIQAVQSAGRTRDFTRWLRNLARRVADSHPRVAWSRRRATRSRTATRSDPATPRAGKTAAVAGPTNQTNCVRPFLVSKYFNSPLNLPNLGKVLWQRNTYQQT
jgi:hypothetical protein